MEGSSVTVQSNLAAHVFSAGGNREWFEPIPGEKIAMRVETHHTNGAFSLTEIIVAPQAGPPLHIHHDTDELLYVIEGTVDFQCNGESFRTGPGGFAAIPRGALHAFRNFENDPARMIVLLTPGGFEQFMHAINGRPMSEFADVAARFGLRVIGPQIESAAVS
jgi:mannose-6-phosphate isomerase-like protein (cupin superfamily)